MRGKETYMHSRNTESVADGPVVHLLPRLDLRSRHLIREWEEKEDYRDVNRRDQCRDCS